MHRYYFDIDDGRCATRDNDGHICGSMQEVRAAAIAALPGIAADQLPDGDNHAFIVKVRDESGSYVFFATLSLVASYLGGRAGSSD